MVQFYIFELRQWTVQTGLYGFGLSSKPKKETGGQPRPDHGQSNCGWIKMCIRYEMLARK